MSPEDFYTDVKGRFIPLSKDWAVWDGDLHWKSATFKHLTCKHDLVVTDLESIRKLYNLSVFNLKDTVVCINCGKQVPDYIKQILLLHSFDI